MNVGKALYYGVGGNAGDVNYFANSAAQSQSKTGSDISPRLEAFPAVIMLMGRRNKGKTLTMTALAKEQKNWFRTAGIPVQPPFKIATNFWTSFSDWQNGYIMDDIVSFPAEARNMLLCIDEIQTAASNRRSMSKGAINIIQFLTMIRKRSIECIFTTQFPQVVDYQILLQVDFFIEVERYGNAVYAFTHDWWGQYTGKNFRKPWPPRRSMADDIRVIGNINTVFGDYNTFQSIPPTYLGEESRDSMIDLEWDGLEQSTWATPDDPEKDEAIALAMALAQDAREAVPVDKEEQFLSSLPAMPGPFQITAFAPRAFEAGIIPSKKSFSELAAYLKTKGFSVSGRGPKGIAERN